MSAATYYTECFGGEAEAVAVASGRVNLLGEHTDYNDGYVLPTAIAPCTEVALGPSRDGAFHFASRNFEGQEEGRVDFADGDDVPEGFARYVYGCVAVLRESGHAIPPCRLAVCSTVPMGAGLSSSAALEVAVLRALRKLHRLALDDVTIARLGQRAEIEYAGVRCGILDQMAVSVGQPGQLLFLDTRSLASRLVPFPPGSEIAILDSGVPRTLAGSGYNERRKECEEAAHRLGVPALRDVTDAGQVEELPDPWRRRARHVVSENARVLRAARGVDAVEFGRLMNDSHASLRDDFEVSVPALDALVECVLAQAGALGCKLTGAGFGGACVALVNAGSGEHVKLGALEAYQQRGHRGSVLL
jgi:galactokinase